MRWHMSWRRGNEMRKEADRRRGRGRGRGRTRPNAVFEPEIGSTHNCRHVSRNKFSGYRVYFHFAGRRPVRHHRLFVGGYHNRSERSTYAAAGCEPAQEHLLSRAHRDIWFWCNPAEGETGRYSVG